MNSGSSWNLQYVTIKDPINNYLIECFTDETQNKSINSFSLHGFHDCVLFDHELKRKVGDNGLTLKSYNGNNCYLFRCKDDNNEKNLT
eukprot:UN08450